MSYRREMTPENMELLAMEVIDLLLEEDMMEDTVVYGNFQVFLPAPFAGCTQRRTPKGHKVYTAPRSAEDIPGDFKNAAAVTVTFEGNRLFQAMNYGSGRLQEKLNDLFRPYDLYLERGYEWNFYAKADD